MVRIKIKTKDFDFEKTFKSGLFYFFYMEKPTRVVYFDKKFISLSFEQNGEDLVVDISEKIREKEKELLKKRIICCLGLEEDLSGFYEICKRDKVLMNYLDKIIGTKIISAFSDFESLVGAIISQNNSYKNYRKQMQRVYKKLNFVQENYKNENLKVFRLGYKIPYLVHLANNFGESKIKDIKGIGNYSINLYRIFQKRDYNSFYMDCLTEKIMREEYRIEKDFEEGSVKLWGKYRGLAEAYLQRFFEEK